MKSNPAELSGFINAAKAVVIATALQAIAIAIWFRRGLQVNTQKLAQSILPGIVLCVPVVFANYVLDLEIFADFFIWSSSLVSELDQTIIIGLHILLAFIASIIIVIIKPDVLDGGFPETRRSIVSQFPNSNLSKRLSR